MQTHSFRPSRPMTAKALAVGSAALAAMTMTSQASTDYGPAMWYAACNYSTGGYGKKFFVVHDIEGYYWGCIYYFARCSTRASVHYTTNGKKDNSSDAAPGAIAQMVRDAYYAWTARCWNSYAIQNEHEGFARNPAWYTDAMYKTSASCTKSKCNKYNISKDRNRVIAHGQKSVPGWEAWANAQGYTDSWVRCNTHTDPGPYWKWTYYMDLVKGGGVSAPSAPSTLTATAYSVSRIDLQWKDNSGIETGFKVERSLSSSSGFSQIATTAANDVAYSASGLASGTKYYFRVRAYNSGGNSGYSGVASATTKDTIPAAPTSLAATVVSDVQINLTWAQAMPNEDGFRIYRSTDGTNYTQVATAGINATSYNNTGLTGNRLYFYKVVAYNTAGNSTDSNTASGTTAPPAPSALSVSAVAGTANWNKLDLAWTDNANNEVSTKIERATVLAGPYSQINTVAAGVAAYQDSGLAATTTYYYRVRTYNANGNSAYSAVASRATGNAPPILTAIGNKTVANSMALTFTATASDPNGGAPTTTTWQTFSSFGVPGPSDTVLFRKPLNSTSTSAFVDTSSTNFTYVNTGSWGDWNGNKALRAGWKFKTGMADRWMRLTTYNAPTNPNPTIALDQAVQFKFWNGSSSGTIAIGLGVRESGSTAAYGANGGITGAMEWVGVTNVVNGAPYPSRHFVPDTGATLLFNIPFESQRAFTGDGVVDQSGAKGTLDHVCIRPVSGTNNNSLWFDDMQVVVMNKLAYSLDAGAPAGATIGRRTGNFAWTPNSGQVGEWNITVRVTDALGGQDFETVTVTVTGTGNHAPILAGIGNKAVNEGSALAFTATATDADTAQTKTFSLDAGNPLGSSINSSSGAFAWTPTEAQGPGSYPITVRVTDNGSPVSNDFETITVTVNEVNAAPVLAAIANQTIGEGSTLNLTASATDSDTPAHTITYSVAGPIGMTINPASGEISYTPGESDGGDVNQVTVTAKDNGAPALSASRTFNVTVSEVNNAPVVTAGTKYDYSPLAAFDELDDENLGGHNNATLFRVPYFSASTTAYLDSTSYSYVTNDFPRDEAINNSYQALFVQANFKTGTVNPWCRLSTYTSASWTNFYAYPNPTIHLGQRVRLKIWSDKSIKVALGVRETGTSNPLGFNGGITGQIEWLGATGTGNPVTPVPSRTVTASNWTQLEFNLPAETITAFPSSGNGVLAAGNGVLEHLAIVPNAGTGIYKMYIDDVEALIVDSSNNITVDTGDTVIFNAGSTDSDLPAQNITYGIASGPTNATITAAGGAFSWTPTADQGGANVITIQGTDDGSPTLSGSVNVTVNVNVVNTPPSLLAMEEQIVENNTGGAITFDANASDEDVPAQTLTYSLTAAPSGATIDAGTGAFSWTPPAGQSTNYATIRVTDNGSPALWDEQTVTIMVIPTNTAPVLSLGTARATETVVNYETFTNGTPNEQVMFKKPGNSSTTTNFIDLAATNYTTVTTSFPAGNAKAGAKALRATWTFKTGTSNYWVRLTTANTTLLPNPTINASARLKFDVYTTKTLKVGVGIRETGTSAENGANGGTTGNIEYVGCSSMIGTTPIPTRTVNAATWTTLELDLPSEPCQTLTGNSVLAGGQQALEHLILVGAGGTGAYDVYLDNFEVVTTTALPGTVILKATSALTFTASATDPDPGVGIQYGMDADFTDTHTNAVLNETNGVFNWTPGAADIGTTNSLTVTAGDEPANGGIGKSDAKTLTIIVNADSLATQSSRDGTFVAGGDAVTLTWNAVAGTVYQLQFKEGSGSWIDTSTLTATGSTASVAITNDGPDRTYRIVAADSFDE